MSTVQLGDGVWSVRAALGAGCTPKQLRGRSVTHLLHGVVTAAPGSTSLVQRARAALLVAGPEAYLCEVTALGLAGVGLPRRLALDDEPIHLHVGAGRCGPQRTGVRAHRTARQLPPARTRGLPCLDLAECWLQLAARATVAELVMVGDGLARRGRPLLVAPAALAESVAASGRRPGIRAARAAVALVRSGTDSPMESLTRYHLVDAGLPEPRINFPILDDSGWPEFFLDMAYPAQLLGVEYDGTGHATVTSLRQDAYRRRRLEDQGWRLITVTAADQADRFAAVVASVRRELATRPIHPLPPAPSVR